MTIDIRFQLLCFLILAISASSCLPLYVPVRHNVPMHSGKNELQGSLSVLQGLNAQAAYSLTNHIGITANYLYANNKSDTNDTYRTQVVGEVGLGYFNNYKENWWIELYTGYGFGKATSHGYDLDASWYYFFPTFGGDEYYVKGKYQKIFFQPSIGYKEGKITSNLSVNCSRIDFTKFNLTIDGVDHTPQIDSNIFLTPAATIQYSLTKQILGSFQVGYTFAIGQRPPYEYEFLLISAGLLTKFKLKK